MRVLKRSISLLLCVCLFVSTLPQEVLATEMKPETEQENMESMEMESGEEDEDAARTGIVVPISVSFNEAEAQGQEEADQFGEQTEDGTKDEKLGDDEPESEKMMSNRTVGDVFTIDGINYKINNDNISLTVTGANDNTIESLIIPDEITWEGYTYEVTTIQNSAFQGYTRLESVQLSKKLTTMGYGVFKNCTRLDNIEIPKSLNSVGNGSYGGVFEGCKSLKTVTFEEGTTWIGELFYKCTSLESMEIPNTVTKIGSDAFRGCTGLRNVIIPDSVTEMGADSFYGCSALETIEIPDSVTNIKYEAFKGCSKLTTVKLSKSLETLGYGVFRDCVLLDNVEIPKSLNSVGNGSYGGVFEGCKSLKTVTFEEGTTWIGELFYKCTSLESMEIPNTVTKIGSDAFRGCTGLRNVIIPDSVTEMGADSFYGCSALETIEIPDSVTNIKYEAFKGCSKLTTVKLSKSLETLGYGVFRDCVLLDNVEIPKSLNGVGNGFYGGIFEGCKSLKTVTFEEGTTWIGELFYKCTSLESMEIPNTVTKIGSDAFRGCTGLRNVIIPDSVTEMGADSFYGCSALETIEIPDSVTNIKYEAFKGCSKLTTVKLSKSLETLGYGVFRDCVLLDNVEIPKSLNGVGNGFYGGVFEGCKSLKTVTFEEGTTWIGELFYKCTSLESIEIPNTVTKIDNHAFYNCTGLKEINLTSIESIGNYAFSGCTNLSKVYLSNKAKSIGTNAFYGDLKLVLYCPSNSYATIYAMNNYIEVCLTDDLYQDGEDLVINRNNSYFATNSTNKISNGYVNMILKYSIKSKYYGTMSNKKICVLIPTGVELVEDTLQVGGELCTDYEIKNNVITIPVSAQAGEIRFSFKPTEDAVISTYAQLKYTRMGVNLNEVIGVVNETIPLISIEADSYIDTNSFVVSGIASTGKSVNIYVNDILNKTVTSNKTGNYKATITLDNPTNNSVYKVKAVTTDVDGNEICADTKVRYKEAVPILDELCMYYSDTNHSYKYVLTDENANKNITFYPSAGYSFTASFSNPENVEGVYIISTRNNIRKELKASWDEKKQCFVTTGEFNPGNNNYVPGQITVEYTTKNDVKTVMPGDEIDFTNAEFQNCISDIFGNSQIAVVESTDTYYEAKVNMSEELGELANSELTMIIKTLDKKYGADFTGTLDGYNEALSFFAEGKNNLQYWVNQDWSDAGTYTMVIHDITSSKMYEVALDALDESGKHMKMQDFMETLGAYGEVAGYLSDYFAIQDDYEDLRQQIYKQGFSYDELQEALKKNEALKKDKESFLCMTMLFAAMGVTAGAGAPALVFSLLLGSITASSDFFFGIRAANILQGGTGYKLNWCIDPSGFVYSGVISNRVEGVRATLYYKETANSTAKLWDAAEYSQQNPLLTDADGTYSWDVPEGLWQVKYEKEGYKTQYSQWLEVPPPQMNVNINMTLVDAPQVEYASVYGNYVEICFTQYMAPETIKSIILKNSAQKVLNYTIDYDTTQTDDSGKAYAKLFKLYFDNYMAGDDEKISVTIPASVQNSGNSAIAAQTVVADKGTLPLLVAASSVKIKYGDVVEIPVQTVNIPEGTQLLCKIQSSDIASILETSNVTVDDQGKILLKVSGDMYGCTSLAVTVPKSGVTRTISIEVGNETKLGDTNITIELEKVAYSLKLNEQITIVPTIYPTDIYANGHWALVDNEEVVSVADNTFTAKGYGIAKVKYVLDSDENVFAQCSIVVLKPETDTISDEPDPSHTTQKTPDKNISQAIKVSAISIEGISKKIAAGKKIQLTAMVAPANATNKSLTWESSNAEYATVTPKGKVTLKKAGIGKTVTITAMAIDGSGVKATYKMKIMKYTVKSITLKAPSKTLMAGKSMTVKTTVKTTGNSANKTLKWQSSNTKYATVNKKGKVTAKKAGKGKTVTITAASTDGSNKKAKVKIKIK